MSVTVFACHLKGIDPQPIMSCGTRSDQHCNLTQLTLDVLMSTKRMGALLMAVSKIANQLFNIQIQPVKKQSNLTKSSLVCFLFSFSLIFGRPGDPAAVWSAGQC